MARMTRLLIQLWLFQTISFICNSQTTASTSWQSRLPTPVLHEITGSPSYHHTFRELEPQTQLIGQDLNRDQCALYKIIMNQQLYYEYIHYKINLPDLKEFTLCMWTKFTNHTNDHPLFSYSVGNKQRAILSWIANTQRSSYYMMNIDGHNLYRLNYPLRINKWYHSCQSWNGRTGEWQIWVNDERVGRGFHNRLVGHVIKGSGVAISGQEQGNLDKSALNGDSALKVPIGMVGELTMLQLYGVALTAGKAHRDHKHHHAHHFEHNSNNNNLPPTSTLSPAITGPQLPMSPYTTGGQINYQVKINPGAQVQIIQNGVTLRHPALLAPAEVPQPLPPAIFPAQLETESTSSSPKPSLPFDFATALANIGSSSNGLPIGRYSFHERQYRHTDDATNLKVENKRTSKENQNINKLNNMENNNIQNPGTSTSTTALSTSMNKVNFSVESAELLMSKKKRDIPFVKTIIDESYVQQRTQLLSDIDIGTYTDGLASFGLAPIESDSGARTHKQDEREPAEGEVSRVMNVCHGCDDEPFQKALIISWRNVPKKLYSGALHVPSTQICKAF